MERPDDEDGVGTELGVIGTWVVREHLGGEGRRTLSVRCGEVGQQIVECGAGAPC